MKKKEMKMPKRNCASVGLLAALALLGLMGCNASPKASEGGGSETIADAQEKVEAPSFENAKDVFMAAPKIETDGEGLIALGQCPQTDKHLKVVLADDNTKAEIYYDGKYYDKISRPFYFKLPVERGSHTLEVHSGLEECSIKYLVK